MERNLLNRVSEEKCNYYLGGKTTFRSRLTTFQVELEDRDLMHS